MQERETVGALAYKVSRDTSRYDTLEAGEELTNDIAKHLLECAHRHRTIFDEDEYCVCYVIAEDPLIKGVKRRKFYGYLYLPSPRPNQAVFLYSKKEDRFLKRLWTLPNAWTMACLSEMQWVDKAWAETKSWCDSFFGKRFWHDIRAQHGITMLSEREYLKAHREELIKAGCKYVDRLDPEPFDFSKVGVNEVVHPAKALV